MKKTRRTLTIALAFVLVLPLLNGAVPAGADEIAPLANPIETVNLNTYASFQAAVEAQLTPDEAISPRYTSVTDMIIIGNTTGGMWTDADRDYLRENLPNVTTLDLSGFTGTFETSAFYYCTSITTVKLPADVALSNWMFLGCTSLDTLVVGTGTPEPGVIDLNGLSATYGNSAFAGCTSITTVKLPADVALSNWMFVGCTSLDTLVVGTGAPTLGVIDLNGFTVTYGTGVFEHCHSITTVKLPANIVISERMFTSCTSLDTLIVGTGAPQSGVVDLNGFMATYSRDAFAVCTSITTVKLPADVALSNWMFVDCTSLDTLIVGTGAPTPGVIDLNGFTATYNSAVFYGCTSITTVKLAADVAVPISMFAFCNSLTVLYLNGTAAPSSRYSFDDMPTNGTIYYPVGMTGVEDFGYDTPLATWERIALSAPSITSLPTFSCVAGTSDTFQVTATGDAPITYALIGAPTGVTIDNTSGLITIAATVSVNTYTFSVTASNGMLPNATQSFTLTVNAPPAPPDIDASINPTTAAFDKNPDKSDYKDISITLLPGSYTLDAIKYGTTTLKAGTDYTVSENTYTIKKEYLATLSVGEQTITFDMSGGTDPTLVVNISDTSINKDAPGTGDYGSTGWWILLSTAALGALLIFLRLKRKQPFKTL